MNETTDYQDFTDIYSSYKLRQKLNVGDIWANAAKCKKCLDVIRSKNRHHMPKCSCGAIAVDGGSWYVRRMGKAEDIEEMVVPYFFQQEHEMLTPMERHKLWKDAKGLKSVNHGKSRKYTRFHVDGE